ncbi:MAG TPA: glucoamylase family protein [Rhodanobacteraceae bacterium]|nr:glucoamylase family protein [Rhodanobacteraceae bacterium]
MPLEPAAEWLLDNFYVIKGEIKEIRAGLPRAYWRSLPTLDGPGEREPRVLRAMRELIRESDGSVQVTDVSEFVSAYQERSRFTLGELWAMPLLLRLALVERLRPLADAVLERLHDTADAAKWAERVQKSAHDNPAGLVLVVADMARSGPALSPAWVSEFQRRMQGGSPALGLALVWLEQQLATQHSSVAAEMEHESRGLAAAQVAISGCIASMRAVAHSDWSRIVEAQSAVEQCLRQDPLDAYSAMDFATRDRYRHAVEAMARHSHHAEWDVAAAAVAMAAQAEATGGDARQRHVGYWLVGAGRDALEHALGVRLSLPERLLRWRRRHALLDYVGSIILLTLTFSLLGLPGLDEFSHIHAVLMALALVIAASHVSVALVNWLVTLWIVPDRLCRMALEQGIHAANRTLVAVPCLLGSVEEIGELAAALEIRQLANRDEQLYFALLADLTDAAACEMPDDDALIAAATAAIETLNARHPEHGAPRFCLFLRRRRWNPNERVWMGHERKRGKIADLNRYLRGHASDMRLEVGDAACLRGCRHVIVLDADTELPPQAAQRLVATLAHPLNRPRIDRDRRRVVEGYGVLQPRMSVGAVDEFASVYARLYSEEIGLDPYTHAVSDVYQDLFSEGSFVGKGIYDIDAFAAATGARFPDNLILSHDLLEGSYTRTGLVSDVELFERQPNRYATDMRRRHRWIRGDWQILPWLLPWVPGPRGRWLRNPLTSQQRWKILDNLRRSIVPLALLLLFLDGWLLSSQPLYWTLVGLAVTFVSPLLISLRYLGARNPRMEWSVHFRLQLEGSLRRLQQTGLFLTMLPYEAVHHIDAIGRSLWRMFVSRRRLLQWTPASVAARHAERDLSGHYRSMWAAPALSLAVLLALGLQERGAAAWASAVPLLGLWLLSPWIARAISQTKSHDATPALRGEDRVFLGAVARRTWRYFERYVDASGHHLPPDNHQTFPVELSARRTSPTNIGLYLVSALSAFDFGYLTVPALFDRVSASLDTLEKMSRHRGHFLNWYDIDTLAPLTPRYVSTVDSGNLIACLLVLARGLDRLDESPLLPSQAWRGLHDTWQLAREDVAATVPAVAAIDALLASAPASLSESAARFDVLAGQVSALEGQAAANSRCDAVIELRQQLALWQRELMALAPWLTQAPDVADSRATAVRQRLLANPSWRRSARLALGLLEHAEEGADPLWNAALRATGNAVRDRQQRAHALAERCRALCAVDYDFLIHPRRDLLAIGYDVDRHSLDAGAYDLLASEARLTVFVAIAQGHLPRRFWFALGRLLTVAAGRPALVSWSGSMFEYLMPLLLMPSFDNTLLGRSVRAVIARQIAWGREHAVPWGVSESGYNITDAHLVYQYRAFGVPGLGLKRGLGDDLVIAPYASALAALVQPEAAARNLRRLAELGALGACGFHEALDFTPARVPEEAAFGLVKSWMAHHQGMSFLALSAALNEQPMQQRFLKEPMFRANQILLQEKVPAVLAIDADTLRAAETLRPMGQSIGASVISQRDTRVPQLQLLSNGHYHVVVSQTGGGYSQCGELAVNPWQGDGVRDADGIFCYVQDLDSGQLWSTAWQPTCNGTDYHASFTQASAEFLRHDHGIETQTRIAVSSEDNLELRRITVTNQTGTRRRLALCSYLEWAMAKQVDVAAHPVFSKLFIETEYLDAAQAILARRRPRSAEETPPVFVHLFAVANGVASECSHETRRDAFLGRGGSLASPVALRSRSVLGNGTGAVLDPIAALRRVLVLEPGQTASIDMVIGVVADRAAAMALAARYADARLGARVFDLAWTREQVVTHQLNLAGGDRKLFARLASSLLYPNPDWRREHTMAPLPVGQSGLWKFGISGDLPIVVVRARGSGHLPLVRQALQAHVYWQMHGIKADLVIWNEEASGYRQELQDRIMGMIGASVEAPVLDRPGGVFVRRSEHLAAEDRTLLLAVAHLVLDGARGSLAEQFPKATPTAAPQRKLRVAGRAALPVRREEPLSCANGFGGYRADGSEYVLDVNPDRDTPRPWCNVLANPAFGTVISERGAAYSFAINAREFRLTPWHNDALLDPSGEAFYLRDNERGNYWSPMPWPVPGAACEVRHGFGYSRYVQTREEIRSRLTVFVAKDAPLKLSLLELRNDSPQTRRLSVFGYVEWVLGDQRRTMAAHIRTQIDPDFSAVFARNRFHDAFAGQEAFFATDQADAMAADRARFVGRNGSLAAPDGLRRARLDGASGGGVDPCAALQYDLSLAPGESVQRVFVLGAAEQGAPTRALIDEFADVARAEEELARVQSAWRERVGCIHVETPDVATNHLLNGWLAYQTIVSRLWARSGFYQSGGAYGFRDQLQDAVALLAWDVGYAREQILRAAAHQFSAGDVQHWWHPPHNRGVRTQISDDYLWLPWALAQYLDATGDEAILDIKIPFLEGRALTASEESWYDVAEQGTSGTLYEHATRALLHGLRFGVHGLPLMGGGDWNDGMNRLGIEGRGESVWLGYFLLDVLRRYARVAARRADAVLERRCLDEAAMLASRIESTAWDGSWYRRAWADDGSVVGSSISADCQIDSLPQSWATLTDSGSPERRAQALDAVRARLLRPDAGLLQLFDPPFDRGTLDPGYIKGYVPGIRENGGQYTHAAVWYGMALAKAGRADEAWQLFQMLNPINRSRDAASAEIYQVEPYVIAADVYWNAAHRGRGGWSWYTGSAGWMLRFALESMLGLRIVDGYLHINPCLPPQWHDCHLRYRHGRSWYRIDYQRAVAGDARLSLDGQTLEGMQLPLVDDGREHHVAVCVRA